MSAAVAAAAFLGGAVISLAVCWLLVSRLERAGSAWACPRPCPAWWRRSQRTGPR